jgi:hypothetical protein
LVDVTDNTLALVAHVPEGSDVFASVDEATKTILYVHRDPNGAKVVAIPDHLGRSFAHMALHQRDLLRARAFLDEIEQQGGVEPGQPPNTVCMALWHAALVSTIKCFQSSTSREKLKADEVFGSDRTQSIRAAFDLLKALRNKHVSHDENNWMTAVPYASVRKRGQQPTLGNIDCLVVEGVDTANIGQLSTVINTALVWVDGEFNRLRDAIRADLLARGYDDLMALPVPHFATPYRDSVARPRPNPA